MKARTVNRDALEAIQRLVGSITEAQLSAVDYAVHDHIGIFIPSVGQCGYAITPQHVHPAYSFVIALEKGSPVAPKGIAPGADAFACTAMSPGVPHEEVPSESFTRYVAILIEVSTFEKAWGIYSSQVCGPFVWAPFVISQSILVPIKQFMAEFEADSAGRSNLLEALGVCILHALVRALLGMEISSERISTRFEVQRVVELMHARFSEKLPVAFWARKAHRSESQFARVFKEETGYSPAEFLLRIRIEKARKLLIHSDQTASEIAYACGFASSAHFSATFRKWLGTSPTRYRKSFGS